MNLSSPSSVTIEREGRVMSKVAAVSLLAALLLFPVRSSYAGHFHGGGGFHHHGPHTRVFVGFGPAWWGPGYFYGPYPYGYPFAYPYGYYPPPYYAYPSFVVQQPQTYIEQQPSLASPQTPSEKYWYYCASAETYYPTVKRCPEAWIKVPPTPQ
jgi:hypothetical protein